MLAQYKPAYTVNDRRCAYTNSSWPWIVSMHKYTHQDVSAGFVTAILNIAVGNPVGRYQIHYKWSSYCDAIDADVRSAKVLAPYGTVINATDIEYDVGHHCWFNTPRSMGQCIEVVTTPQQCQAICSADSSCQGFQMFPLQLDPNAPAEYGLFPGSSFVPWGKSIAFCDKAQFANAPKTGSSVCFPIYSFQDDFNSARPLWSFTDDIDHQGFYGTCYIKPRSLKFLNYTSVAVDPQIQYRFGAKCIPCDNIGQDLTNPRWGPQQNYCTDCDKYPTTTPKKAATVPSWTYFANGTFTAAVKWLSPAGSPFAFADECAVLAARDTACSKYVMYSDVRAQRNSGSIAGLLPTSLNVNSSTTVKMLNVTPHWHYTNFGLNLAYYRSCACLPAPVQGSPAIDATGAANACQDSSLANCYARGFLVYQLA